MISLISVAYVKSCMLVYFGNLWHDVYSSDLGSNVAWNGEWQSCALMCCQGFGWFSQHWCGSPRDTTQQRPGCPMTSRCQQVIQVLKVDDLTMAQRYGTMFSAMWVAQGGSQWVSRGKVWEGLCFASSEAISKTSIAMMIMMYHDVLWCIMRFRVNFYHLDSWWNWWHGMHLRPYTLVHLTGVTGGCPAKMVL